MNARRMRRVRWCAWTNAPNNSHAKCARPWARNPESRRAWTTNTNATAWRRSFARSRRTGHRGWRRLEAREQKTRSDYAHFLRALADEHFADAEKIVLVQDNLNTHSPASLYEAFPPQEAVRIKARFEFHFTPKHGSWMNIAEIELSALARGCLARRIADHTILARELHAWQLHRNHTATGIRWQFTTADARTKLRKLYPSFDN